MKYDVRFSIDTLYIGLRCDAFDGIEIYKNIKKNLFFKRNLKEDFSHSRNKYYSCESVDLTNGFACYFSPRRNLKNDYFTIQLGGVFFRNIFKSYEFISFLFENYGDIVVFQRVDVAMDICYKELDEIDLDDTKNVGFPMPTYSDDWTKRKIPFEIFGRYFDGDYFINQVSQGKDDLHLRVYDKDFELQEKYKKDYHEYYDLDEIYLKVFRIEFQMRSDKLKSYLNNCLEAGFYERSYESLIECIFCYVFSKYRFKNVDTDSIEFNKFYLPAYVKRCSSAQSRATYHKNMMVHHALEFEKCQYEVEDEKKLNKFIKKLNYQNIVDKFKDVQSCFDIDFYKCVALENSDNMSEIPF